MKNFLLRLLLPAILAGVPCLSVLAQGYNWSPVRIGGGGRVTSFYAHPKVPNLYFITTDVGTSYKWNNGTQRWDDMLLGSKSPLVYWNWATSQVSANLALDPNDVTGNTLYITVANGAGPSPGAGLNNKGTVWKSTDRGESWTDCGLEIDVKPNSDQTFADRIVVDPQNSNYVWVTTRSHGTWRSNAAGAVGSWTQIATGFTGAGNFIKFDITGGTVNGVTRNMFIGTPTGMYRSTDGGSTFSAMVGGPTATRRASISKDGIMFVTTTPSPTNNGVWKWNGSSWSTVSPDNAREYKYVSVNPDNSNEVIAAAAGTWSSEKMYRSTTGGNAGSWTEMTHTRDNSEAPHSRMSVGNGNIGFKIDMVTFDPFHPGQVWFTDLIDVVQTTNVWAPVVHWKLRVAGLEEIVAGGPLVAPPYGRNLLHSTTGDVGGFDHVSLTEPPATGMSAYFSTGTGANFSGVDVQQTDPDFLVRIGSDGWDGPPIGGYSTNGGVSYTRFTQYPAGSTARGRIAVSANSRTFIWVPMGGKTFMSNNLGASWVTCAGLPDNVLRSGDIYQIWAGQVPVASDKVSGNIFYVYARGKMYVSEDTGRTFSARATGLPDDQGVASNVQVLASPGRSGDVWFSHAAGLYHSVDTGRSFTRINPTDVPSPRWMAIGTADTTAGAPLSVFVLSGATPLMGSHFSVFRSDNLGVSWDKILDPVPSTILTAAADRHGRIFMALSGNGLYVGEPSGGPVTGVNINPPADTLVETDSVKLAVTLEPQYPVNRNYTLTSLNPAVATVDANGWVRAIAAGTTGIVVTTEDGSFRDTTSITVTPFVHVTGVALDTAIYTGLGNNLSVVPIITPADATNKKVTWSSSDSTILRVSSGGIITAVGLGQATLTATSVDGNVSGSTTVNISTVSLAYNMGDTVAIGNFRKDPDFHTWTGEVRTTNAITVAGVANAGPEGMYKSARSGLVVNSPYNLSGLHPGGRYTVRLHFAELASNVSTNRVFHLNINNVRQVTNFNIYSAAGNARYKAVVREFVANASSTGVISVRLEAFTGSTLISGIEAILTPVDSVTLPVTTAFVGINDTLRLTPTVWPLEASNRAVTWTSSNPAVVSVSPSGLLTGTGVGTAVITVITAESSRKDSVLVTADSILVDSVRLSVARDTVSVRNTKQLSATVYPANASDKAVIWSSSDTTIVKVSASGLLTGVAAGTVNITATSRQGGHTATIPVVSVVLPVSQVNLNYTSFTIGAGDTATIRATALPANASNTAIVWSSSDTTVARVNQSGFITAVAAGSVNITAAAQDGNGANAVLPVTVTAIDSCGQILNNGFESGFINWSKPVANSSRITMLPADVRSGTRALQIYGGENNQNAAQNYAGLLRLPGGVPYTLSFYAKVAGSPNPSNPSQFLNPWWSGAGIDLTDSSGAKLSSAQVNIPVATSGYTRYVITGTTPANTFGMGFWISKVGPGYVFIDDVCMTIDVAGVTLNVTDALVKVGGTRQLNAAVMPATASNTSVTWTTEDTAVAQISTSGLITGKAQGTTYVIARSADGLKSDTAAITVAHQLITVNAGGTTTGGFNADHSFTGGLVSPTISASLVNTTGVNDAAPAAVYTQRRYGNHAYRFHGLMPNNAYTVRLHLIESYYTQANKRLFDVRLNNSTVISSIDLYAAGGLNKAIVRDVTGVADSAGVLRVDFVTVKDNAAVAGLELYGNKENFEQVIGINSADTAAHGLAADNSFTWGAASGVTPADTISTKGTVNALPASIYQKRRYGTNFNYNLTGLAPNGSYVLRLHLMEPFSTSVGQRVFDVRVNNVTLLNNLDVFAFGGNKRFKALTRDIPVTADSAGVLYVQFLADVDNAAIAGLQVLQVPGSNNLTLGDEQSMARKPEIVVYESMLKVSPNPVSGNIRFSLGGLSSDQEQLQVTVTNMNGREVYRTRITSAKGTVQHELQNGQLQRGIYILQITGKNFRQTARVVVL
ncbi:Ig-like domain-containing protein [Chitinophaga horti]|uniref:Ig-like domain-containing protein n=1 Tax=Chitinophaga horti TaxID=2920382 RepID=A0ABY6J5M0_9BACT|nr:Ig-like domain-containing protein [Chitinophaga horti]UYQ94917.1 Ig-like domain-containing protein [Chitinophaga horti]